jgi:hypothetical protein
MIFQLQTYFFIKKKNPLIIGLSFNFSLIRYIEQIIQFFGKLPSTTLDNNKVVEQIIIITIKLSQVYLISIHLKSTQVIPIKYNEIQILTN